jgi:hypothetical protein
LEQRADEGDDDNKEKQTVVRMNFMIREGMQWKNITMRMVQEK